MQKKTDTGWGNLLDSELHFWRESLTLIKNGVEPNLASRLQPTEIEPRYIEMVPVQYRKNAAILDVGSGPLTHLGTLYETKPLQLVCVDALADKYSDLLKEFGFAAPVPTQQCNAEELVAKFGQNKFDLVTTTNALDHCRDPVTAVQQMIAVAKPGRTIYIELFEDEGDHAEYDGLHQWNFSIANGGMEIWRPDGFRIRLYDKFHDLLAKEEVLTDHPWRSTEWGARTIATRLIKR